MYADEEVRLSGTLSSENATELRLGDHALWNAGLGRYLAKP
jgi:hypothetical protein